MAGPLNQFYNSVSVGQQLGQMARAGVERRKEKQFLNKLAQPLSEGDYEGAAKTAFESGRVNEGMNFRQYAQQQAQADAQAAAQANESFRNDYSTVVDTFARLDALRSRGVLDDEKYQAAVMNAATNMRPLVANNEQLAAAMPGILQQVNSAPPGTIAAYSEEFSKAMFEGADPMKQADLDIKKSRLALDQSRLGLDNRKLDADIAKMEKEAEQGKPPELGDVLKVQDRFEKQAQTFEQAQRQYNTMQNLADDATGASDVALGFAFFKTIDPGSTVREGEFANAASAMGLPAQMVTMFRKLDQGEKFSPQLRRELVAAAGRAYEEQKTDMVNLQNRTAQFAERYNIPAEDVARNVVRGPSAGAGAPPAGFVMDQTGGGGGLPEGFELDE